MMLCIWQYDAMIALQGRGAVTGMITETGLTGDKSAPILFDAIDRGAYRILPHPEASVPAFSERKRWVVARRAPQFYLVDKNI
jgi:hypothetical protein